MSKKKSDDERSDSQILTERQKEQFSALRRVLQVKIDGDWDEEMIQTAFDNLERVLFRVGGEEREEDPGKKGRPRSRSSGGRRKKRRR